MTERNNDVGQHEIPVDDDAETLPVHTRGEVLQSQRGYEEQYRNLIRKYQVFSRFVDIARDEAIKATRPQDWLVMASAGNPDDDVVYPWSPAAEKMATKAPWLSIQVTKMERVEFGPDSPSPFGFVATGRVVLSIPGLPPVTYDNLLAGRAADKFFESGARGRGDRGAQSGRAGAGVNELHLMQAAQSALMRVAVTRALGMRNMTRADLARVVGKEFADKIGTVERKTSKVKGPEAGFETDAEAKDLEPFQRAVRDRIKELFGTRYQKYAAPFLQMVTKWPEKNFAGYRDYAGLKEGMAKRLLSKMDGMDESRVEDAIVAIEEGRGGTNGG